MARKARPEGATERRALMARRLRQIRQVLEGNQAEVARNVGVSVHAWNRYELGARDIPLDALAAFCRFYAVSADWVLMGDLLSLPKHVLAALVAANPDVQQRVGATSATQQDNEAPAAPMPRRARSQS